MASWSGQFHGGEHGRQSVLVVGIDWAKDEHQVCVVDDAGAVRVEWEIPHSAPGLHSLAERLRMMAPEGDTSRILVGIEIPRGAIVDLLVERGFGVYALNPKQMDRFRDRYFPAGSKDDRKDAFVIADALRTDRHCFREVQVDHPIVLEIREHVRIDDDLREEHNRLANRMQQQLHRYFPQLLQLSSTADERWVLELLERVPTPEAARKLRLKTIAALLKKHRIRRIDAVDVRKALSKPDLTLAAGTREAASKHVQLLIPRLRMVIQQRKAVRKTIEQLLERYAEEGPLPELREHRDVEIILSLPGVGVNVAATMLAEAQGPLERRDYRALRAHAGIAPVTKASGRRKHGPKGRKRPKVLMRQACNGRLRNALYHWGRVASQRDPSTRDHYARLRAKGHTHGRAIRGVGDRLLRILMAMLRDGTLYDPEKANKRAISPSIEAA